MNVGALLRSSIADSRKETLSLTIMSNVSDSSRERKSPDVKRVSTERTVHKRVFCAGHLENQLME
jgi:hypothetical protein